METLTALAEKTGGLLLEKELTLGLAESCTGGLLGAVITEIPGSSKYFQGGIVAYQNKLKRKLLKVPATVLRRHGAVSPETAAAMARGARKATKSKVGVSITGVAGPDGGQPEKPIGLVYIGLDTRKTRKVEAFNFSGNRREIRLAACCQALEMLTEFLKEK